MEQVLSSKIAELLNVLDQVKKYKEIISSMIDLAIILSATAVAVLTINLSRNFLQVFYGENMALGTVVLNASIWIIIVGIIAGMLRVTLRVTSVKVGEWKSVLNEGAPGAIKLLEELKWETIFNDIRSAKLGVSIYGITRFILFWISGVAIFYFLIGNVLGFFIHLSLNVVAIGFLSLVFALAVSSKDLRRRYQQIGHLDSLLWELRWFESEFRRADFKT
jgi:O-antigen/teichoic acid export membrane protein